jgi:UDP-glucose 4-epimerase
LKINLWNLWLKKGTETRDWTYVDDIIDGLLAMGIKEAAVGEAINLGSGKEHRVIDMADMVNRLTGNEAGIRYAERRDWDVKTRLLSSIEKAKKLLDYEPQMKFEDGLKRVHEWFLQNREDIERSVEF